MRCDFCEFKTTSLDILESHVDEEHCVFTETNIQIGDKNMVLALIDSAFSNSYPGTRQSLAKLKYRLQKHWGME